MVGNKTSSCFSWIIALLIAIAPNSARAAEETAISINAYGGAKRQIPIVSKDTCVRILAPILEPEKIIAKGIGALQEGGKADAPDCLKEVVLKWKHYLPAEGEDPRLLELMEQKQAASQAVDCVNPHEPGSETSNWWISKNADLCKGKFFQPSDEAALLNKSEAVFAKLNAYRFAKQMDENFTLLALALLPSEKAPSGKEDANAYLRDELRQAMRQLGGAAPSSMQTELRAINRRLACAKNSDAYPSPELTAFCLENSLSREENAEVIKQKLRALIPDVPAYLAKWKAGAAERHRLQQEKNKRIADAELSHYSLRRLIAHQSAFAKQTPEGSLEDFCATSEQEQTKDFAYAQRLGKIDILATPADWLWAAEFGSTEAEIYAVRDYTSYHYRSLNEKLRKANDPVSPSPLASADALFVEKLNQALSKAKPYVERPVRRFSMLPDEVLAAHEVGKIVNYASFTSTSRDEDWSWKGGKSGSQHFFLIYGGKNGIDVNAISSSPGEKEVLFKAGTRFKVLSRKERRPGSNVFDFVMAEVDELGNVIAEVK